MGKMFWARVVVIGQQLLYSGKLVVFGEKWLYTGKIGCIREKVVVLQKVVIFWHCGCIRVN